MDSKKTRPGILSSPIDLGPADKQISVLCDKILPHIPHLLSVPTKTPYQPSFPHENKDTPFEAWEVMKLQYMTLVSNGDRGVGCAQGNWEDETSNARSPSTGALSSTSTPNQSLVAKDLGKPAVKLSFADYQKFKTTGVKPSPRPASTTPESRPRGDMVDRKSMHSRNTSAVSHNTPAMARVPSFEGDKPNGLGIVSGSGVRERAHSREERCAPPRSVPSVSKDDPQVNGKSTREFSQRKDVNKDPKSMSTRAEGPRHSLPPRPQSPRKSLAEYKQIKRPLESGTLSQPEKRLKVDKDESTTPSNLPKSSPRKSEVAEIKTLPPKPPKSTASPHPPKKAAPPTTKPLDTKPADLKSRAGNPTMPNLPPLLSPLPVDLVEPPQPSHPSVKKLDANILKKTPSPKPKSAGGETIVVKAPNSNTKIELPSSSPLSTPPASSSPRFVLPPLLSPNLPPVVEAELLRLQQKSSASALNTVEARHQEVRQPNAPGVAQKRPKVGHPPKKSHAESSIATKKSHEEPSSSKKESAASGKPAFVVKIPYKKRLAKGIDRLLRTRPNPWPEFKKLEAKRLEGDRPQPPHLSDDSESEGDTPLHKRRGGKVPAKAPPVSASRKRPCEMPDLVEPEPKRTKVPDKVDAKKASTSTILAPAFKSPAPSGLSASKEKTLLATPKKGDAMKSVAMRRVDSGDAHARTPQAPSSSAPASAEKPRVNGSHPVTHEELSRSRQDDAKFSALGTDMKRKLQAMLKSRESIPDKERKAGVMCGVEGLMAYMIAFRARGIVTAQTRVAPDPKSWEDLFPIFEFVGVQVAHYPELTALVDNLGAVSREHLNRVYLEQGSRSDPGTASFATLWGKIATSLSKRDKLWMRCKTQEKLISDLRIHNVLGPWSTVTDAVTFGVAVLNKYSTSQKLEWEIDSNLSSYTGYVRLPSEI